MNNPKVHYANDGLGPRKVLVNGRTINRVIYANQSKGVVEFVPCPVRRKRNGDPYTRKVRGVVQVIFTGGHVSGDIPLHFVGEKCEETLRGNP